MKTLREEVAKENSLPEWNDYIFQFIMLWHEILKY